MDLFGEGGSLESDSDLNIKSYEDCSSVSFDKITLTSVVCLDDTDLQASQDSAFKSSTDLLDNEDPTLLKRNPRKCEQTLRLTDGSSMQIETSGNNVILSKIKLEEISKHKTEIDSLNWISKMYDTEMQSLHQKLKELKYHIQESKCPSMKCRRRLEHLTKQALNGEGYQLDFVLNRNKITSLSSYSKAEP